jgi:hypothetical protein
VRVGGVLCEGGWCVVRVGGVLSDRVWRCVGVVV